MFFPFATKPFEALASERLKDGSLYIIWTGRKRVSILQRKRTADNDKVELHHIIKWHQFLLFGPARFRIKTFTFDHRARATGAKKMRAGGEANDITLKDLPGSRRKYFRYDGRSTFEQLTTPARDSSSSENGINKQHDYKRVKYVQELMEKIKDRVSFEEV